MFFSHHFCCPFGVCIFSVLCVEEENFINIFKKQHFTCDSLAREGKNHKIKHFISGFFCSSFIWRKQCLQFYKRILWQKSFLHLNLIKIKKIPLKGAGDFGKKVAKIKLFSSTLIEKNVEKFSTKKATIRFQPLKRFQSHVML